MAKISLGGSPINTLGELPKVGESAKNFTLVADDLSEKSLSDFSGKRVVLNIFPSIDTGVCAASVRKFNQEASSLNNTVVINISKDLPFALGRFCADKGVDNAVTVSDYKYRDFENQAGLLIEELGLLARAVFVVDTEGVVRYKELCEEVGNEPDFEKALEEVKNLSAR